MDVRKVPAPVKAMVHLGSRSYGRMTAPARMAPSFLICGGQRCGTTSLYRALAAHPVVLKAVLHKGVHYFDTSYRRGMSWYRGHFPLKSSGEKIQQRYGEPAQTFESSPYYMYHPQAAARIARDLPGAKLVVLVRDPVERAYSGHSHELARGYETEPFDRAVALEAERLAGERERMVADPGYESHAWQHHAYLRRGQYHEQLVALERLVGRERLHVVDSQDFWTDPEPSFAGVLRFLGLPPHPRTVFERHNARSRSPLPAALRTELEEHFAPHDERLAAWLGRTPSWRR